MGNFVEWLHSLSPPVRSQRRVHVSERVPVVLATGDLNVVYQPIVDFEARDIFAYEALVRSSSPHFAGPPSMFVDAIRADFCGALGRIIRQLAVDSSPSRPLFLNIHPAEFDEPWLVQPDDPIFAHEQGVYLEITESVPLSHVAMCHSVLAEVRNRGAALAVDDLGAGYSNLKYIADLSPEIVKLDRGLVANITHNSRQHRLMRSIVRLCEDLGAKVVAEGIETRDEANAAIDAGVHYGQGYFFARPGFPPTEVDFSTLDRS